MDKIVRFARTFPSLANAPLDPWDPEALDLWAAGPTGTTAARHAAACVLMVWRPSDLYSTLRSGLCDEFQRVHKVCIDRLNSRQDEPSVAHHVSQAKQKLLIAWRAYQVGDMVLARKAAEIATKFADECVPLDEWLKADHSVPVDEVLRQVVRAAVWTVGPFNVGLALAQWNSAHRAAFLAWAADPW